MSTEALLFTLFKDRSFNKVCTPFCFFNRGVKVQRNKRENTLGNYDGAISATKHSSQVIVDHKFKTRAFLVIW